MIARFLDWLCRVTAPPTDKDFDERMTQYGRSAIVQERAANLSERKLRQEIRPVETAVFADGNDRRQWGRGRS